MAASPAKAGKRGRGGTAGNSGSGNASCAMLPVAESHTSQVQFKCERCLEACTCADSHPVNAKKPFEKRKCCACCATDRALQRAQRGNAQFKKEWASKTPEQRASYYRTRKADHQRGTRHNFDQVTLEVGEEVKESGSKKSVDTYIPFETWRRDKILEEPDWEKEDFEKEWSRLIHETDEPKIFERNQWLLGRFEGVRVQAGSSRGFVRNLKRQAEVESADMLAELMETSNNMHGKYARTQAFSAGSIQPAVPALREDVEGEQTLDITASTFGISLQRELAKKAMEEEKEVAEALSTAATETQDQTQKKRVRDLMVKSSRFGTMVSSDSCISGSSVMLLFSDPWKKKACRSVVPLGIPFLTIPCDQQPVKRLSLLR